MLKLRGAIKLSRSEREYSKIDEARDEKEKLRIGEMNLIKRSLSGDGEGGKVEKRKQGKGNQLTHWMGGPLYLASLLMFATVVSQ